MTVQFCPILSAPAAEYDTTWTVIMQCKTVGGHLEQQHKVIAFDQAYCKVNELI